MRYSMLNIGNGTFVTAKKINAITKFDSAKIRKEVAKLRDGDDGSKLVDASKHKVVKAVVIMENGTHVLSNLTPETLVRRLGELTGGQDE